MKKNLFFFFFTLSISTFSQIPKVSKFEFDHSLKYNITEGKKIRQITFLVNSKDPTYVLKIFQIRGKWESDLISFKDKTYHIFSVSDKQSDKNFPYYLQYQESKKFDRKLVTPPNYKISKINDDLISLDFFNNKRMVKKRASYLIKLVPNEDLNFDIYRLTLLHPFEEISDLSVPGNFIVSESEVIVNKHHETYQKLIDYKKIDISIEIP